MAKRNLQICDRGHRFYKTSKCPVCPICESERQPSTGFLSLIYAPARRALEKEGITDLETLSTYTQKEILSLHGMGTSSIPILEAALKAEGLKFKREKNKIETD